MQQWRILVGVQALFGLAALAGRGRATHRHGVGGAGVLRIVRRPTFPPHELLAAGRTFPVRLRHANLEASDDAAMDVRGASLKLADADEDAPLDLVMNTGEASLFRDLWVFLAFVGARPRGASGFRGLAERYPREWAAGAAGWRIGPSSYARLRYHSQIVTRFRGTDGGVRWVRYRLIPGDRGPEDGLPEPARLDHPISLARRADDRRPQDYLRAELRRRLAEGPVRYWLQLQLHVPGTGDPPEVFDSSRTWDAPWHDLGEVVLDRALDDRATEALRFNVGRQPDSLGLLPANGPDDYNAIGWLRERVYPLSQLARTFRRSRPVGPPGPRAVAAGRLVFDEPVDGADVPLHHVAVELWDRDLVRHDLLGRAETDADGRFEIPYDPADAGPGDLPDLELRVLDGARVVARVNGGDDVMAARYDFGTVRVRYWEYVAGPLARIHVPAGEDPPQDYSPGRRPVLLRNLARGAPTRGRHGLVCLVDPHALSLDEVQEGYPPTPPVLVDRDRPGHTRTDAWFVDRLLNGFYPAPFEPDGDGRFRVTYRFDGDETNGRYELPNVAAWVVRQGDEIVPERIVVWPRRGLAPGSGLAEPLEVRPHEGDRWAQAKRVFTSVHLVAGEVDGHLCRAHLDVEQYAMAAFRNLRRSPLLALLAPHLKEVTTINWQGAAWVYGESGIVPRISGLTPSAVGLRFVDQMGRVDWRGFAPPEPLVPSHRWARVAGRFWDLLGDYLDEVLERDRDGIAGAWHEVRGFSRDLSARSAPFTGDDPGERIASGGAVRSVHPFVLAERPNDDDLRRIHEVCRYAIFRATLWHTWINDKQLEDGGDVRIGTLGLRNGGFGTDRDVGPWPVDASEQLYLVAVLVGTAWGRLLANEDGDVPPELTQRLRASGAAFAADGLDVAAIRSRVNI